MHTLHSTLTQIRLPQVLDAPEETQRALQTQNRASPEALEALAAARARFLRAAASFLRPCLQEAVVRNLTRDDPLAPPTFERRHTSYLNMLYSLYCTVTIYRYIY